MDSNFLMLEPERLRIPSDVRQRYGSVKSYTQTSIFAVRDGVTAGRLTFFSISLAMHRCCARKAKLERLHTPEEIVCFVCNLLLHVVRGVGDLTGAEYRTRQLSAGQRPQTQGPSYYKSSLHPHLCVSGR